MWNVVNLYSSNETTDAYLKIMLVFLHGHKVYLVQCVILWSDGLFNC